MKYTLPMLVVAALAAVPSVAWAQEPAPPPPPVEARPSTGIGMIVTGSVFTGLGVVNLITAPICLTGAIPSSTQSLCLDASLVFAGITLVIGIPLLAVGVSKHNTYVEWKKGGSFAARLTNLDVAPTRGGATVSWQTTF